MRVKDNNMKKIYEKNYVVILQNNEVIWAAGSDEWMNVFKPNPNLKYSIRGICWDCSKRYYK